MQVTNLDIWQAKEPLGKLVNQPWPVKTAYWLAKLARKVGDQYGVISGVRDKLIAQYGTVDEKGMASISAESPNWRQFVTEMNELMAIEVEIPIEPIVLPDREIDVEPATLMALEAFVEVA